MTSLKVYSEKVGNDGFESIEFFGAVGAVADAIEISLSYVFGKPGEKFEFEVQRDQGCVFAVKLVYSVGVDKHHVAY